MGALTVKMNRSLGAGKTALAMVTANAWQSQPVERSRTAKQAGLPGYSRYKAGECDCGVTGVQFSQISGNMANFADSLRSGCRHSNRATRFFVFR